MYKAYIVQPHGCDYTIACGYKLIDLEATEHDAAVAELRRLITTEYQGDIQLSNATLLHVTETQSMPVSLWYQDHEKGRQFQEKLKQEQADRELYERLHQRFG